MKMIFGIYEFDFELYKMYCMDWIEMNLNWYWIEYGLEMNGNMDQWNEIDLYGNELYGHPMKMKWLDWMEIQWTKCMT